MKLSKTYQQLSNDLLLPLGRPQQPKDLQMNHQHINTSTQHINST